MLLLVAFNRSSIKNASANCQIIFKKCSFRSNQHPRLGFLVPRSSSHAVSPTWLDTFSTIIQSAWSNSVTADELSEFSASRSNATENDFQPNGVSRKCHSRENTTRARSEQGQLFSQANINFTCNLSLSNGNFYWNSLTFQPLGARSELRDVNSQGGFFHSHCVWFVLK